jgi:RNA polymerase sigma-70 factor, ECF subfamily
MEMRPITYKDYADEQLLGPVAVGAADAFAELYYRYGQKMFSYFFRMLWKDKQLAEDQTQELFLKVIRQAKRFDADKSFSTWLYSMAHNMCKNEYRRSAVRAKYRNMKQDTKLASQENQIDLRKFKEAVHVCIDELNEEKRSLFILRFQEQLSVPDISRILSIPEGTVKSRLFYLLKEMKEKLKQFQTLHNPL